MQQRDFEHPAYKTALLGGVRKIKVIDSVRVRYRALDHAPTQAYSEFIHALQ